MKYPNKVKSFVYRLKYGEHKACVSFVFTPKNPELGFNITLPGALGVIGGSMISFLNKADAENFAKKYVPGYIPYMSAAECIVTRIDENCDIPCYAESGFIAGANIQKLSKKQLARLNDAIEANPFANSDPTLKKKTDDASETEVLLKKVLTAIEQCGIDSEHSVSNRHIYTFPINNPTIRHLVNYHNMNANVIDDKDPVIALDIDRTSKKVSLSLRFFCDVLVKYDKELIEYPNDQKGRNEIQQLIGRDYSSYVRGINVGFNKYINAKNQKEISVNIYWSCDTENRTPGSAASAFYSTLKNIITLCKKDKINEASEEVKEMILTMKKILDGIAALITDWCDKNSFQEYDDFTESLNIGSSADILLSLNNLDE